MKTCAFDGCNRQYDSKGYCTMHYDRLRKHGDVNFMSFEWHGEIKSPEYRAWTNMKNRCNNPKYVLYHRYGARGITVCNQWQHSFKTFLKDMGKRPSSKHSIDRIDNDGNYEPSNCRWATTVEQVRNRSITLMFTIGDVTKPLKEFCDDYDVKYKTAFARIKYYNWSLEKALGINNV